jgi:CheY-like chemotaxis protein
MLTKKILSMYSKTILLVDDGQFFLKMAEDSFRREQVNILTANSGPEAVDILKENKIDLVFMDLYMPGGDGDEACREIKSDQRLKSTPIVMMTSSDRAHDINRCKSSGCDDLIQKPLTREKLPDTSRKFIKFPVWSGERVTVKAPAKYGIDSEKLLTGFVADVSVGGVFLEADELMPVDTKLHIGFELRRDSAPIDCKGRVCWLNRKENLKKDYVSPGMGIEFIDIKKLHLLAIQGWMAKNH